MKTQTSFFILLACVISLVTTGCGITNGTRVARSSSLVGFLYPGKDAPPPQNVTPQLPIPLRVGLAFLPSANDSRGVIAPAQREELLNRVKQRFADRSFVRSIAVIPDYYLAHSKGIDGLKGLQRLYSVDVIALVSYDQITHTDDNELSLGYLTIVGAYVLPGTRHEVATLVDLAVIDPETHSLILRAGGVDGRHGLSTMVRRNQEARESGAEGFSEATNQMIANFDNALTTFEADVRAGKAEVKIVNRDGTSAGAVSPLLLLLLTLLLFTRKNRRRCIRALARRRWRTVPNIRNR
jgi:rhombotail lipoprotein